MNKTLKKFVVQQRFFNRAKKIIEAHEDVQLLDEHRGAVAAQLIVKCTEDRAKALRDEMWDARIDEVNMIDA